MNKENDKFLVCMVFLAMCTGIAACIVLIVCKAAGVIEMRWPTVLSSFAWITWILWGTIAVVYGIVYAVRKKRTRDRVLKAAALIRARAIELGVWDNPKALGGAALTLSAWEHWQIARKPEETDVQLRRRCLEKMGEAESSPHGKDEKQ